MSFRKLKPYLLTYLLLTGYVTVASSQKGKDSWTPSIATVAPSHAQTGVTSTRIVHLTVDWIDSTRPEPWTPDPTDHRGMLIQAYYRPGALEPAPLVLFSPGRDVAPKTYADLAEALARDGYVVAIVDHLGERSGQRLPNG